MSHPKSCRCKMCCSSLPDCNSYRPDCCSHHWKNRFCKLRKQWSEHSKCGSVKHIPEDCTHCRSPCDKTIGRFGVAWVAEIPDCDNGDPKGWQVEIIDTTQGILNKCKELIEWLNNPPAHLFDNIKGNDCCNIRYPKCQNCEECWEEPCPGKDQPYKCKETKLPKKCRISCCEEDIIEYHPCCKNSDHKIRCTNQANTCQYRCCEEHPRKSHCKPHDDSSDGENSKPRTSKCRWSTSPQNDDVFRKDSCCCHCQEKFFKNAGTSYESDIVPQKDQPESSQMDELDSKVICAHIRTSQICKKMKEERRNQLMDKHERELNTVIANMSSDDETAKSLFMAPQPDNYSVMNSKVLNNSTGSQRRSSKFRRKESV